MKVLDVACPALVVESILLNLVAKIVLQYNPRLKRDFERHRRRPSRGERRGH